MQALAVFVSGLLKSRIAHSILFVANVNACHVHFVTLLLIVVLRLPVVSKII